MATDRGPRGVPRHGQAVVRHSRRLAGAFAQLLGGIGTAVLALGVLLWAVVVAVLCVIGLGLLLAPSAIRAIRSVADRERARMGRWGTPVVDPPLLPSRLKDAVADDTIRRETRWLSIHATWGVLIGVAALCLPIFAVRDLTFPLWWWAVPDDDASAALPFWLADSWTDAYLIAASSVIWMVLTVALLPRLADWQQRSGRRWLAPPPGTDLPMRVAVLTATRAAALDAHATELRRIECSLHDSTQNPLVGANVLIGAARRRLADDPATADDLLEQAQSAVEHALGELRSTVRSILPPVLADRGLDGAISGLAATSAVPTAVDVHIEVRCPASVEASAYFMVSEALTNVARHSGADHASVSVRGHGGDLEVVITDDGRGGAAESSGSGLAGIRRRVEAHDGELTVTSPAGGPTTLRARIPCGS